MKRNKTGTMPTITRDIYKGVKKFDRQQLQSFCKDPYGFEFEDGQASVVGINMEKIYEAIENTKGIGPKKLQEIKASIEAVVDKKGAKT